MIEAIDKIIDKYAIVFKTVFMHPMIFIGLLVTITIAGTCRYIALMHVSTAKTEKDKKMYASWARGHTTLEAVVMLVVAYTIIKLTGANKTDYILNWVVAPFIGGLMGIIIDNYVFTKFEKENGGIGPIALLKKYKGSSDTSKDDKKSSDDDQINIVINNGNSNTDQGESFSRDDDDNTVMSSKDLKVKKFEPIKTEDLETDAGYKITADMLNSLQERQAVAEAALDKFSKDLIKDEETIKLLRRALITDKRNKLKKAIYKLLDQGYATPAQNDTVVEMRKEYMELLNGKVDHDLESLYNERYSKLGVHEDRRKKNMPVDVDRRKKN
jgi:hypothetical protein